MFNTDLDAVWLGASFDHHRLHWYWDNGDKLHRDDTRWDNHHQHSHECLALIGEKFWSKDCSDTLYQLCETQF